MSLLIILQRLVDEWISYVAAKESVQLDQSAFRYEDVKVPRQNDAVNCGVFVLKHMLYTLDNMHLNTDLCSMNQHREKWAADMLRGKLDHVIPFEIVVDK